MNSILMNNENQEFDRMVDQWVCTAINNGATDFNSLLHSLPGVYPTVALDSLNRLVAVGNLSQQIFSTVANRANENDLSGSSPEIISSGLKLPIPHPLNYDWRFSNSSLEYLLNYCSEKTKPDETIAFLGAPSVYLKAIEISFPRKIILLDNNSSVINYFSENTVNDGVRLCNILKDSIPADIKASMIVIDPPWYEKHLLGFMWAAANICIMNGQILISLPPIGTRPGIENDLRRLFEWSERAGLVLANKEKGILPYISPPFEMNALRVENLYNISKEWRRGDLALFVKKQEVKMERPLISPDSEEQWLEETVNGVRIKLKPYDTVQFKDPKLLTIIKTDVFPTISRRDPRRRLVEVWTSGNRVYACKGRFVLHEILRELNSQQSAAVNISQKLNRKLTKQEENLVQQSRKQLMEIINIEREENKVFANGNNQ